jgi:cellulose synthase (UDP-forming)
MDAQGLKDEAGSRRAHHAPLLPSGNGTAVRDAIAPARAPREFPSRTVRSLSALSNDQRAVYWALTLLWLVVLVRFWTWWLRPEHQGALGLYLAATIPLAYLTTVLPSFYWFFVARMRRPVHIVPAAGRRVAMITLCVPSHETLDVIAAQLEALTRVRYPHDSWVLDEGGDPDVEALAAEYGVRYFTRKGRPAWNQPGPPFQAKTKAGNVNAWLDHVGMHDLDYDVFVQLDIDHHPTPEYLDRTLGYFDDPAVAWVQAPSVAGNLEHWTARGLAEQDVVLQGPLQMGFYGHSHTPFIIGSHTTYRTEAVRGIGGFQPTRAEDHLDTVVLAAAGHTGVYVPEIIATGEGPADLGTYLGQQFAWAYSMVQIFLQHTPRLVRRYTPGQAFQFLMAQGWYTLWSLSLAVLWVLPVVALLTGRPIANVSLFEYLTYNLAVVLAATLMWRWSRRWFQPSGIGLTWRGMLLETARWPIVLWAVVNAALRVKRPYMITPKGARAGRPPSGARLYGPPIVLAELALGAVACFQAGGGHTATQGYLALVMFNLVLVVMLLVTALALEVRDLRRRSDRLGTVLRWRAGSMLAVAAIATSTVAAMFACWAPLMEAMG